MNNKKLNTRRKILLGLTSSVVGASQLPTSWTKPVVNSVLLPAHAQTTDTDAGPTPTPPPPPPPLPTAFSGPISFAGGNGDNTSPSNQLLSLIVSDAYAGQAQPASGEMCITIDSPGGSNYTSSIRLTSQFDDAVYEGNGTVSGGASMLALAPGCFSQFGSPTIDVTNVTAAGAEYTITAGSSVASGTLAVGTNCPVASDVCSPQE